MSILLQDHGVQAGAADRRIRSEIWERSEKEEAEDDDAVAVLVCVSVCVAVCVCMCAV